MEVFIVEDEEIIQALYTDILEMRGHKVWGIASTGEEAIEKFGPSKDRPDLVIMDHRMPGMGGLDAARSIMEIEPDTRIILVSADDHAVWEALKMGIVGMRKPINIGDLLNAIEAVETDEVPPVKGPVKKKKEPSIQKRGIYLIDETDGATGIRLFMELLDNGANGIAFTRKHPDDMTRELGDDHTPIVWFTSTPVKGYTCISPVNIQKMLIMIRSAFSKDGRSAALVRGFEYVLTNLQFDRALNLIQVLNDRTMSSEGDVVLLSLDLSILEERQKRLLIRECEVID
jgi:two-component system chemotaxis response regulator CheY